MKLSDFNDKHLGETIYIIGCAPTLNQLTDKEIEFLNKSVTIGVNFSHLKVDLKYWIGGHIEQAVFALESDLPYDVPLFAHNSDPSLVYATQVWENETVQKIATSNPNYGSHEDSLFGIRGQECVAFLYGR